MGSKPPPSDRLAAWLGAQRWFGGKRHRIVETAVVDSIEVGEAVLHLVDVALDNGDRQRYAVPLLPGSDPRDALSEPAFVRGLLRLVREEARAGGRAAVITGQRAAGFADRLGPEPAVRTIGGEQSNTSVVIGDALILKQFRRVVAGVNPELEITQFLTETAGFPHTPALAGWLQITDTSGQAATLAVLQGLVANARDGWQWMLASMRDEARRASTVPALHALGETTSAMHLALASAPASMPALAPERVTDDDLHAWLTAIVRQVSQARSAAAGSAAVPSVDPDALQDALTALRGGMRSRHHGDFHLGQTLYREAAGAWTIIDFEGEPMRTLAERRAKHSPLRDVAGLLRSIAYAAETLRATDAAGWIDAWERDARAAFLSGYFAAAGRAPFVGDDRSSTLRAVAAFEVEKAAYEVVYEANNRPDWLAIPLRGLARAAAELRPSARPGD